MYPAVGEVNLHAVDVVDLCRGILGKHLLDLHEDGVDIGVGRQVDAVLGNLIVGELTAQLADLALLLGQRGQEEGDAHEGITAIVTLGIDDAAIAFTANDGPHLLHLRGDVDLTDSSSSIATTILLCDITQSAGAGEIRYGGEWRQPFISHFSFLISHLRQHIVGDADQRILLAKHLAVLTDEGQTVNVGVDNDAEVIMTSLHLVHDALQVLL